MQLCQLKSKNFAINLKFAISVAKSIVFFGTFDFLFIGTHVIRVSRKYAKVGKREKKCRKNICPVIFTFNLANIFVISNSTLKMHTKYKGNILFFYIYWKLLLFIYNEKKKSIFIQQKNQ